MKGTFVQNEVEFNLDVNGETWRQGQMVMGRLTIKNTGSQSLANGDCGVRLAWRDQKKLKAKDTKAYQIVESKLMEEDVPAGKSATLRWRFHLKPDCPITEKRGSLHLLFGQGEDGFELGQLELQVSPLLIIDELFKIYENFFRFKLKETKTTKGQIEAKFVPPSSKEFATLEGMTLLVFIQDQHLNLNYKFAIKKIESVERNVTFRKDSKEHNQVLTPQEYLLDKDAIHLDQMRTKIDQVLDLVRTKGLF